MIDALTFAVGWLLFVLAQAQNSIRSKTNNLSGKAGWANWFQMHAIELAFRAFVSALLYGYLVHTVAAKIEAVGLQFTGTSIAGFAGIAANSVLYQFFGLVPWLRVEVGELAPPEDSKPMPPTGPAGTH